MRVGTNADIEISLKSEAGTITQSVHCSFSLTIYFPLREQLWLRQCQQHHLLYIVNFIWILNVANLILKNLHVIPYVPNA